jgi:hypothetical protein
MQRILAIVLIILVPAIHVWAQTEGAAQSVIEQRIEELTELSDQDYDYTELYEHFSYLHQNPLLINNADAEQLRKLLFLNESQIAALLYARDKFGNFKTIYELKEIDGFYIELLLQIQPFISFEDEVTARKITLKQALRYGKNDFIIRYGRIVQPQAGFDTSLYPDNHYLGSPSKLYFRYKYTFQDRISFGLVGEKDAGEEFFAGSNPHGFDFYSLHLFIRTDKVLRKVAVGDYHLEFGQGLTLWSGIGFSKSSATINTQRSARGLRPNSSANESLFMRGAAVTLALNTKLQLTPFYSLRAMDASTEAADSLDSEELYIQSLQETGYHRTPTEIANEKAINEQIFGANLNYIYKGFKAGITAYQSMLSHAIQGGSSSYEKYDFSGKSNFNAGFDFSYANRFFSTYGEAALSKNGGKAVLLGSFFNLSQRLNVNILYRNYSKDYQNQHAAAFGESSSLQNEQGILVGINLNTGPFSNLSFYYDLFKFPWLRYRVNRPSQGHEFSLQYTRNPSSKLSYYARYQFEEKYINQSNTTEALQPVNLQHKHSGRLHLSAKLGGGWKIQSRVSFSAFKDAAGIWTQGYLLYTDLDYQFPKLPLSFSARYAIVHTDDYDTRIYAYEKDVLYKFSIPAYYDKGQRFYLLLNYDISQNLQLWFRYSQSVFTQKKTVGSGLDEIEGNRKSEFTFQLRLKI